MMPTPNPIFTTTVPTPMGSKQRGLPSRSQLRLRRAPWTISAFRADALMASPSWKSMPPSCRLHDRGRDQSRPLTMGAEAHSFIASSWLSWRHPWLHRSPHLSCPIRSLRVPTLWTLVEKPLKRSKCPSSAEAGSASRRSDSGFGGCSSASTDLT